MVVSYLRLINLSIFLCIFVATNLLVFDRRETFTFASHTLYLYVLLGALGAAGLYLPFFLLLRFARSTIERFSREQADFLDDFPARHLNLAIIVSAGLSLFLELAVIRWQGEIFPIFAFYKNYSLLTCFAGLGLGYALAQREAVPLLVGLPILVAQFLFLLIVRYGPVHKALWATPFAEQLNMGVGIGSAIVNVATYFMLAVVFLLTVLGFLPIGQLCGRLMAKRDKLAAYGFNLIGSILGVIAVFIFSYFWTPPVIWFSVGFAILLFFQAYNIRVLMMGITVVLAGVMILSWPVTPGYERLHTPYQLLERGAGQNGLAEIKAAGHFYQRVYDLSAATVSRSNDQDIRGLAAYYELPYMVRGKPAERIAIVGAGTGNDVAAALRHHVGHVDAIEIDPGILSIGRQYHPEKPYDDSRVDVIVNDARTFLRTTERLYDMIIYGLLDSHTLLSQASSVRLDSFVYTVEGLREARQRLKPNGLISLSFAVMSDEIGRKIYLLMKEAFGGIAPICVRAHGYVAFLQTREGRLALDAELLATKGFTDITRNYANSKIEADVPTDDWPFFYMPKRVYPFSYFGLFGLILALSLLSTCNFMNAKPVFSSAAFFFLGAGFMLIETRVITELGLAFGNTWQVIGIVICAILSMIFLANCVVRWFHITNLAPWYLLLVASLLAGYFISHQDGFDNSSASKIVTVLLLTVPMFFSGIVFSTLLARTHDISGVMAVNLLGAMTGGILEYNSMYFGFRFLYLLALAMYLLALVSSLPGKRLPQAA